MAKDQVEVACDASLKQLATDYIDVYFIHYPSDPEFLLRYHGRNDEIKRERKNPCDRSFQFQQRPADRSKKYGEIDVIQPCYSLVWRFLDHEEMNYCIDNNIGIISYSTLAQGILTGKFTKDTVFPSEDGRSRVPLFQSPHYEGALDVVENFAPLQKNTM